MDNKYKILNYLAKNRGKHFSMHGLSKLVDIPYASFHRTIQDMGELVELEAVGKSKIIDLKVNNQILKSYLVISSDTEKIEFLQKHLFMKKISNELHTKDIVLLFGSYAKGKENEKSDIDLLIINKNGKKTLSFSKYELLFKKKINPLFMTEKEFRHMLKEKQENIGKQVVQNHIILENPESFWRLVLYGF